MTTYRVPPHDPIAETAVLNACIESERALLAAIETLSDDDFYTERHRRIFRALEALAARGQPIDPITLSAELEIRGELEAAGGREYIGVEIMGAIPTTDNVKAHASIVREKAELRRLIERATEAANLAYDGQAPAAQIAADLQRHVLPLAVSSAREGFVRMKDDLWPVMESIEAAQRGERRERVIPSGYRDIDERISGGFQRGHFIVLAGVPGSAKTAIALNFGLNAAFHETHPVGGLFVSAEMTRRQVVMRSLASESRIPLSVLRRGALQDDHFPRLARAAGVLSSLPFWTDETPTPDIGDVIAKCRQKKSEHPDIGLIIVDFIQLVQRRMEKERRRSEENRSAELTAISYALQALAKDLDVAVIATSQVDAAQIEKRSDKRPQLGDMRWSQGMREAAHLMATVYRPKMYEPDEPDTIELAFQKGRDDPPFTATFNWIGQYMRMEARPAHSERAAHWEPA